MIGNSNTIQQYIKGSALALTLAATGVAAPAVMAQEEGALLAEDMKIGFSGGVDLNTHFISYGLDVWQQGSDWGGKDTLNPWAEVALSVGDFTFVTGIWGDINDNASASIGGEIQEVDWWIGASYAIEEFTFGLTYQAWEYAGGSEKILDVSVAYDDSELWGDSGFSLSPSVVFHKRLASTNIGTVAGGDENSWVVVLGVETGFTIVESETYPIDLAIPVSLGIFTEDGFHGATAAGTPTDSGFGFVSVGAIVSMPLTFVPAEYGAWSVSAGVTYYHTNDDVIANDDDDFVTGTLGFAVGF